MPSDLMNGFDFKDILGRYYALLPFLIVGWRVVDSGAAEVKPQSPMGINQSVYG